MITVVVLSAAAGAIAAVLFVPISVRAEVDAGENVLSGGAELRWGHSIAMVRVSSEAVARFYLFGVRLYSMPVTFDGKDETKIKKKKRRKKRMGPNLRQLLGDGRPILVKMIARGARAFHPHLYIDGTIGLGDPGNTALLLMAARQIDSLVTDRVVLNLRDDYLEDTTQLVGHFNAWIVPTEVVLILLIWLVRSDTRRVLRGK